MSSRVGFCSIIAAAAMMIPPSSFAAIPLSTTPGAKSRAERVQWALRLNLMRVQAGRGGGPVPGQRVPSWNEIRVEADLRARTELAMNVGLMLRQAGNGGHPLPWDRRHGYPMPGQRVPTWNEILAKADHTRGSGQRVPTSSDVRSAKRRPLHYIQPLFDRLMDPNRPVGPWGTTPGEVTRQTRRSFDEPDW
jgi:hypothetical protein